MPLNCVSPWKHTSKLKNARRKESRRRKKTFSLFYVISLWRTKVKEKVPFSVFNWELIRKGCFLFLRDAKPFHVLSLNSSILSQNFESKFLTKEEHNTLRHFLQTFFRHHYNRFSCYLLRPFPKFWLFNFLKSENLEFWNYSCVISCCWFLDDGKKADVIGHFPFAVKVPEFPKCFHFYVEFWATF